MALICATWLQCPPLLAADSYNALAADWHPLEVHVINVLLRCSQLLCDMTSCLCEIMRFLDTVHVLCSGNFIRCVYCAYFLEQTLLPSAIMALTKS